MMLKGNIYEVQIKVKDEENKIYTTYTYGPANHVWETMTYKAQHTAEQRKKIEEYLRKKYGEIA